MEYCKRTPLNKFVIATSIPEVVHEHTYIIMESEALVVKSFQGM